jgi:hypothetical protein
MVEIASLSGVPSRRVPAGRTTKLTTKGLPVAAMFHHALDEDPLARAQAEETERKGGARAFLVT